MDRLLADSRAAGLLDQFPRVRVVEALRAAADEWRSAVRTGDGREWLEEGEGALWRRK